MSQAAAKHFIAGKGGKIINIASMLSFQGGIRVPSYTASKSAVMGVTRLLANEWAKHNINVNAIAPGYMATNNTSSCVRTSSVARKSSTVFRRALGSAERSDGAGCLPGLLRIGLHQRLHRGGGRRLAGALIPQLTSAFGRRFFCLKIVKIHIDKDEKSILKIMNDGNHTFILKN
jgi:NAD(P)-dependent dehydrogenase (short-subunit alcohol dehydrogenase family)